MQQPYFDDDQTLGPEDLQLLHDVLVDLCRRAGVATNAPEATSLASMLIALYKSGFRSKQELMFMASD